MNKSKQYKRTISPEQRKQLNAQIKEKQAERKKARYWNILRYTLLGLPLLIVSVYLYLRISASGGYAGWGITFGLFFSGIALMIIPWFRRDEDDQESKKKETGLEPWFGSFNTNGSKDYIILVFKILYMLFISPMLILIIAANMEHNPLGNLFSQPPKTNCGLLVWHIIMISLSVLVYWLGYRYVV